MRLGRSAPPSPRLFWVKKEKITEGRKAGRANKTKPPLPLTPAPLVQDLDPRGSKRVQYVGPAMLP